MQSINIALALSVSTLTHMRTYTCMCADLYTVISMSGASDCVAACCSALRSVAMCCNLFMDGASECVCSALQCVAVCCNVLQCVAVCCNVLQ